MDQIIQLIKSEYMVLVAALYLLGRILRRLKKLPNQFIPFILTICGILLAGLSVFSRYQEYINVAAAVFDAVVQGILCAGMSVYTNEVVKHCGKGNGDCKNEKEK